MKFQVVLLVCVLLICSTFADLTSNYSNVADCIWKNANDVRFIFKNLTANSEYNDHRVGENARTDNYFPTLIVNVTSVEHIQASVKCAGLFQVQVIPMNGGHSFEGLSSTNNVLLNLDMYHNATFDISNSSNPFVTVQSGIRLGRLYGLLVESLYAKGSTAPYYVLAGGTCPTVGVTGHTVCGGYGLFGRKIGLTSDQILSYEVVYANGSVITVNDSNETSAVFWALRGSCSSSFGIVSTITFRLYENENGPNITIFNPKVNSEGQRALNGSETVISGLDNITQTALWFQSYATYTATNNMTMNINFKSKFQMTLEGVFMGPKSMALEALLDDMTIGLDGIFTRDQISNMFVEGSYLDAILWWTGDDYTSLEGLLGITALPALSDRASRRKAKSSLIRTTVDAIGIQTIANLYNNSEINQMEWKAYGGVNSITTEPYTTEQSPLLRGHLFEAHYSSSWKATSSDNETTIAQKDEQLLLHMNAVQSELEHYAGFSNNSYVGYIDLNSTGEASLLGEVYFGAENAALLRELRSIVDPDGVLSSVASEYLYPTTQNVVADVDVTTTITSLKETIGPDLGSGNTKLICKRQFGITVCDEDY